VAQVILWANDIGSHVRHSWDPLIDSIKQADGRLKRVKRRSLQVVEEHFETACNTADPYSVT